MYLEDIWGSEAVRITEEIISAAHIAEMVEKVERKLVTMLRLEQSKPEQLLQVGMQYMYAERGMLSSRTLAEKLNYSERNVRRIFKRELGVSPKELLGIIRFQHVLQDLYRGTRSHFTDIALENGFYDQPHFINTFKRYYGLTPKEVFQRNKEIK